MEQANKQQTITEKKKWETPKAELVSTDAIKTGSINYYPEGFITPYLNLPGAGS